MNLKATVVFAKTWEVINATNPDGSRRYKYIIHEGSSRSSKTYSIIDAFDTYARANEDKRLTAWRDTKKSAKDTILFDTQKHFRLTGRYLKGYNFNKTESVFSYTTGSTYEIHGTDDEEAVHGMTQDVAWLNEPYKISKDVFDQIDQRTSDFVVIDWNPKKAHWIEQLKKDPKAVVIKSTFRHNPFCPPGQREKILRYQPVAYCRMVRKKWLKEEHAKIYPCDENPRNFEQRAVDELARCQLNELIGTADMFKWSVYGLGEKAEKPNRIFRWEAINDEDFHALDVPTYYGVDWGNVDPFGIVEVKYYDGALYLHQHNYASENVLKSRLAPQTLAEIAKSDEGFVMYLFNRLGINKKRPIICDSNRPNKIRALRRAGWEYALAAKTGSQNRSIVETVDLLSNLKVFYTKSSTDIAYEQENYSRKVDRYGIVLEEPEDEDNHLIDPTRYVAEFLRSEGIINII